MEKEQNLEILFQGAESRVYASTFHGRPCVLKDRFPKPYRHPTLDRSLNQRRLSAEVRALARASRGGVRVPCVYYVDSARLRIGMERIEGPPLRESPRPALLREAGRQVARLHRALVVHGDLTTSNFVVRESDEAVFVIDFGLAFVSAAPEDRAVDLHVLERALVATHPEAEGMVAAVMDAYAEEMGEEAGETMRRLEAVRLRGRKKLCFG